MVPQVPGAKPTRRSSTATPRSCPSLVSISEFLTMPVTRAHPAPARREPRPFADRTIARSDRCSPQLSTAPRVRPKTVARDN